jgi:hypothetical protein
MDNGMKVLKLAACFVGLLAGFVRAEVVVEQPSPQASFAKQAILHHQPVCDVRLSTVSDDTELMPEGFRISCRENEIMVSAADAAGLMYGGLEVAELLGIGGEEAVKPKLHNPYLEMRGVKFNIPLDVRTPSYSDMGDAGQQNMDDVWDLEFWKEFIDQVALHRYNYISLWNLHPFPSLVKVPEYPDVALADVKRSTSVYGKQFSTNATGYDLPEVVNNTETLKTMSIEEKISFWQEVMRYGKQRNVDFYFVTWNIFDYSIDGKYGIDDKIDNPITADYFRKSVEQLFLMYPDLKGIGLTTGENMHGASQQQKEDWAYRTYGQGVLDVVKEQPDRKITFLHRQHQAGALEIADTFKSLIDHPSIDFIFSFKYAKAHVYSSTRQPYHKNFVNDIQGRGDLKTIWTMRNDSVYLYRWAAPDFVREFVQNIPNDVSRGYYFGSDGWVWGRDFLEKDPQKRGQLELKKHWFQWLLWGRLAYDPNIDDQRFVGILQTRFPGIDGKRLMNAWQSASMIYPLTTGFHWGALDFQWYIEGCKSLPGPANTETGFHDVNRFITLGTHPSTGYVSIPNYVKAVEKGKTFKGIGPNEISDQLHEHAAKAQALIKGLDAAEDQELADTLADIETIAYLGHYYGHKIKGATELHLYRHFGEKSHQRKAVIELEKAAQFWRLYTANSADRYANPIWYNRVAMVDWDELTQWVDDDIEIAKQ